MKDGRIFYLFNLSNAYQKKIRFVSEDMHKLLEFRSAKDLPLVLGWVNSWEELERDKLNKGDWELIK